VVIGAVQKREPVRDGVQALPLRRAVSVLGDIRRMHDLGHLDQRGVTVELGVLHQHVE
jgi:hypothetical protein